jgi:hypothetical protein
MTVSKQVLQRLRASRMVVQVADTHRTSLANQLQQLFSDQVPGEDPANWEQAIQLLGKLLQKATQSMEQAEQVHQAEIADDLAPRVQRDDAAAELYRLLIQFRDALRVVYGENVLQTMGFKGNTPQDPLHLQQLTHQVQAGLSKLPSNPANMDVVHFDFPKMVEKLTEPLARLTQAMDDVTRESRELEITQRQKQRTMDNHDRTYGSVATVLSHLFVLASEPELADRVRPTMRRSSSGQEEPVLPDLPDEPSEEPVAPAAP